MKKKIGYILTSLLILFFVGCNKDDSIVAGSNTLTETQKLVCTSKAKNCYYKEVEESEIGEAINVCDDPYGTIEITFVYNNSDAWENANLVTTYDKNNSTDEIYEKERQKCLIDSNFCEVKFESEQIIVTKDLYSNEFQNGTFEEMAKYMKDLGYICQ